MPCTICTHAHISPYRSVAHAGPCLKLLLCLSEAVAELRAGNYIVVLDDEDRENEGDLILAAQHATPAKLAFIVEHSSGYLCVPMLGDRLDELELPLQVRLLAPVPVRPCLGKPRPGKAHASKFSPVMQHGYHIHTPGILLSDNVLCESGSSHPSIVGGQQLAGASEAHIWSLTSR